MKKNMNIVIWVIAAILILAAAYTVYTKFKPLAIEQKDNTQQQSTDNTVFAPDFTLKDIDGNSVKLSDYKGKIVILNFWAVWCKYCVQEMPDLNELNKELGKDNDVVLLAINSQESLKTVNDYLSSAKLDLNVLLDEDGSVTQKYAPYGIEGLPTTFIINSDGSFYTYISGMTYKKTLLEIIEKIRNGDSAQ